MTEHAWRMMTVSLGDASMISEASLRFTVYSSTDKKKNQQVRNLLSDTFSQDVSGPQLCPEQCGIQPAQAHHRCANASSPMFVAGCEQHGMQQAFLWLLFAPLVKAALLWAPQELYQNSPPS